MQNQLRIIKFRIISNKIDTKKNNEIKIIKWKRFAIFMEL